MYTYLSGSIDGLHERKHNPPPVHTHTVKNFQGGIPYFRVNFMVRQYSSGLIVIFFFFVLFCLPSSSRFVVRHWPLSEPPVHKRGDPAPLQQQPCAGIRPGHVRDVHRRSCRSCYRPSPAGGLQSKRLPPHPLGYLPPSDGVRGQLSPI